ncbi:MAG TPA: hypothetical protein VK457_17355 [Chloroflexota bacterium]|nr:hypothetical protein [Chloroflexota bacterium]
MAGTRPQLLLPSQCTWRRQLQAPGSVVVSPGDVVQPDTIVAEGQAGVQPLVVELGEAQPIVLAGQEVQAGEMLARRKKMLGRDREIVAPAAGKVLLLDAGELLLQPPPVTVKLDAQLPGIIAAVRPAWGADVEGCFGLLRGCASWGPNLFGRLGEDLAIVAEPLTAVQLAALAGQGIKAVIAPSWEHEPARPAPDGPAVFLTEPLPGRPMAPPIAEALQRHKGQPVALRLGREPLLGFTADQAADQQCFGAGSWVRSAEGHAGRLVGVGEAPRFFPSGLRATPAEVDFGDSTETLPIDSLEWIA